jgi:flagellar hook assembly protein FlgD
MVVMLLDVDDELPLPEEFMVAPAYPNPFNPSTNIDFTLPEISDVTIAIYDILGREIFTYNRTALDAGYYSIRWNGTFNSGEQVPTGVYIVNVRNSAKTFTQKITLLK